VKHEDKGPCASMYEWLGSMDHVSIVGSLPLRDDDEDHEGETDSAPS
jgi:hypothetical protein